MKFVISLILVALCGCECANILGIFPTPSISHQVVFHALMKDLAARGHHLTILTTDLIKIENPNVTQINLEESYITFRKEFNFLDIKTNELDESDLLEAFMPIMFKVLRKQINHPEVQGIIHRKDGQEFDVLIFEYLNYFPMLAFAEIFDCPVIGITSLDSYFQVHEDFGNEANPVLQPESPFSIDHKMSFSERWKSLKFYLKMKFLYGPKNDQRNEKFVSKHFPNVTSSISKLKERVQLLMTNTNPALGFIRPLLPNTIQLGFMHIEPAKPLQNGELKTFLDNSKNGVIYMSLGSNVPSKELSPEILQIFLKVFGRLSYDVLWKFDADELHNIPDNVMCISKWTPQSDLLAHPKIKVFITQSIHQQCMEEAIDRTVPLIVIPFFAEQDSNSKRMVSKEIGYHLELHSLTELKLMEAINEMLKPKYKKNIKKLRTLVYDQPMTSRERAVWWTEYVIRHKGAKHLEYPGRLVPFYQKYWLDFIVISIVAFIVTFRALK